MCNKYEFSTFGLLASSYTDIRLQRNFKILLLHSIEMYKHQQYNTLQHLHCKKIGFVLTPKKVIPWKS